MPAAISIFNQAQCDARDMGNGLCALDKFNEPLHATAIESEYDSCRRGYYERGIPYDFYACEQLH